MRQFEQVRLLLQGVICAYLYLTFFSSELMAMLPTYLPRYHRVLALCSLREPHMLFNAIDDLRHPLISHEMSIIARVT